jgi:putative sugar O-methyltransferase
MGRILTYTIGKNALESLADQATVIEKSSSIFWKTELSNLNVSVDGEVDGVVALGNASAKLSLFNKFAHSFMQWPLRRLAAEFPNRVDCLQMARHITNQQNRLLTNDVVRQANTLALIRKYLDIRSQRSCNLVIGDGYGVLATLFAMHAPHLKTIVVNLTKPLLLDLVYFNQVLPDSTFALVSDCEEMQAALNNDSISVIAVRGDDASCLAEAPIGLAANVVSMQEMTPPVVAEYFQILRNNKAKRTAFYCCNKLYKKLADGTELKFNNYPWRENDEVLHDSICPWSQWYYDKKPPFWHHRKGKDRVIWHRLAYLEKDT